MVIMLSAVGSGCIEVPETAQWSVHTRQDLSVTNGVDAQNEPAHDANSVGSDMAFVAADAFVTDEGIDLGSRLSPLAQWTFAQTRAMPLQSTGEVEGLTFVLNGGAVLDANGLNLMTASADAASTNAFLTGDTGALFAQLTQSNTFSIRLWVWTKHPDQTGPARIFTWSQDAALRNLTIGQLSGGNVQGRVRFDNGLTNENGLIPVEEALIETSEGRLSPESGFHQLVFQYGALGNLELWVDDTVVGRSGVVDNITGGFSTWDPSFAIALGDELSNSQPRIDAVESASNARQWRGVIHSLEIYADPVQPGQITTWLAERPVFQTSESDQGGAASMP